MVSTTASVAYPKRRRAPWRRALVVSARAWVTLPLVLWALLWLSINTGPWNLEHIDGGLHSLLNALRASFPVAAFAIGLIAVLARPVQRRPTLAETGFWLYALFMFISSFQLLDTWFFYAYWAMAFLATTAVVQIGLSRNDPIRFAHRLNIMSWLVATAALVTLLMFARQELFAGNGLLSAYGVQNRLTSVGGTPMSRASGLSRMAAVPAIVALVYAFRGRWWQRALAIAVFVGSVFVIWIMQSRGSLFAFLGAFLFVLLFGDRQARRIGLTLLALLAILSLGDALSGGVLHHLWLHATRNTGSQGFRTMSGRPRIWHNAWGYIKQAPWLGYGPRGDRRMMGGDAQNAIVYAMMNTGLLGTVWFVAAMASAWFCLIRLLRAPKALSYVERTMVTMTGGILVFCTLRSIPEDTAAFFSIDLLLQYPAMVYLAVLYRRVKSTRRARRRIVARAGNAVGNRPIP